MPTFVHIIHQGWRRKPSTFKQSLEFSFIVFVLDFVEGEESKIIEWVGAVHGEDKVDAS